MRQAESSGAAEFRKSSADVKRTTSKPAALITRCNMRDIDGSSSITEMTVFIGGMLVPLRHLGVYQREVVVSIVRGFSDPAPKYNMSRGVAGV